MFQLPISAVHIAELRISVIRNLIHMTDKVHCGYLNCLFLTVGRLELHISTIHIQPSYLQLEKLAIDTRIKRLKCQL